MKLKLLVSVFAILAAGVLLFENPFNYTFAGGGACSNAEASDITGNQNLLTFTTPSGEIITSVCIKSGSSMFTSPPNPSQGHSGRLDNGDYENSCYTVSGVGTTTVEVKRNFRSNECQGISHIDVYYSDPDVTPPPLHTRTPTPTPTPSPSDTPTETPGNTQGGPTSTPTPTLTPAEEPTSALTDEPGVGGGPIQTPTPEPQVLGLSDTSSNSTNPAISWAGMLFLTLGFGLINSVYEKKGE